jgi:hypothetical protein
VDALAALAGAAVPPEWSGSPEWPGAMVSGVALRASQVQPGDLFAALPSVRPGVEVGDEHAGVQHRTNDNRLIQLPSESRAVWRRHGRCEEPPTSCSRPRLLRLGNET